ncbi:MAG: DUF4202 domain-containing protein [Acidimicrobiales bacterium]
MYSPAHTDRFAAAVGAVDAANAEDPVRLVVDGLERPKEVVHADVVERWVRALDSDASEAQLLAARAHHLRRWVVPRSSYPEGRAGYLRWRRDHKQRQAAEVAELLAGVGYDQSTIDTVASLVAKKGLGRDPQAQVHEDALCLAFVELQLDDLIEQLGEGRTVEVVIKTMAKMSDMALAATSMIELSDRATTVLTAALAARP